MRYERRTDGSFVVGWVRLVGSRLPRPYRRALLLLLICVLCLRVHSLTDLRCCRLTGLTSYSHLLNLENLDISRNEVDSLRRASLLRPSFPFSFSFSFSFFILILIYPHAKFHLKFYFAELACLRHLRELRADGNTIASVEGLERMDGLVKLSLEGNALRALDLQAFRWTRLEMLNVSGNRLERVDGLAGLQALVALNVGALLLLF